MSEAGKQPVRVIILGQQYSLRASGDPREMEDVARSVDELLQSISDRAPASDSTRIAVLGCLHLADQSAPSNGTYPRSAAASTSRVRS